MLNKWYVLQVFSGQEKKVKQSIEDNRTQWGVQDVVGEVLLPIEHVSEVKKGEKRIVEKKLWPGYLLVKMEPTPEAWQYVKQTNGVIDFLGGTSGTPLTDNEVNEILQDLEKKKGKVRQRQKFEVGDRVRIVDGVFINFIGTVIDVANDKGTLSVMVSIFGRDTRVDDLEFWQVEPNIEEEEEANQ